MHCSICLEEIDQPTTLTCNHSYHQQCLFEWGKATVKGCASCPNCREPLRHWLQGNEAVTRYNTTGIQLGDIAILTNAAAFGSNAAAFTLGNIYFKGFGTDKNDVLAEQYWKQSSGFPMACHNLAILTYNRGQTDQAADYYRKAIALNPAGINYYMNLGKILGHTTETHDLYSTVLALYADNPEKQADVYILLCINEYNLKHLDAAFAYVKQSIDINPANVQACFMAAITSVDVKTAHEYVDRIILVNANNVGALCLKAKLYLHERNVAGADTMYSRVSALSPDSVPVIALKEALRKFGPITRKRSRT